ncbi:ROK family protein [Rhodococcus sp. NPDC056960]|uniref:ROK family protein n=1 Tax=Rhodococcus sp. NPDC056960 TaxID=3345982 RepID=UPI0036445EA8
MPDFAPALQIGTTEPLIIDNDVNWATIAESRTGSMANADNFLYVYLGAGAGVGAGLFLSGGLHRGAGGTAGEIAFLRMSSGETLMSRLGHSPIGTPDGRSIDLDRARALLDSEAPDHASDAILDDLAHTIVNVTTAIEPGRIVIGGPLSEMARITEGLRRRIEDTALTDVQVTMSPLGRTAPLEGAAIGALELAHHHRANTGSTVADAAV